MDRGICPFVSGIALLEIMQKILSLTHNTKMVSCENIFISNNHKLFIFKASLKSLPVRMRKAQNASLGFGMPICFLNDDSDPEMIIMMMRMMMMTMMMMMLKCV